MPRHAYPVLLAFLLTYGITVPVHAEDPGRLRRSPDDPAVYYVLPSGRRLAFPNEAIFSSWFPSFETVETVPASILAQAQLVGSVFFHPGSLIKITTDPKVYLVTGNGELRWIQTEAVAAAVFGQNWASRIHDLSDAFFSPYHIGEPISLMENAPRTDQAGTIAENQKLSDQPMAPAAQNGTPSQSTAPAPASAIPPTVSSENITPSCQTFSCAHPLEPTAYDRPGTTVIHAVPIGSSYPLGNELYIRNEGVADGRVAYTVWNKTPRGCRIVHNMTVAVNGTGTDGDIGDIVGDAFTEINTNTQNDLIVKKSTGNAGFARCSEYYASVHPEDPAYTQCQLLPHPGAWSFRDGADERVFETGQWGLRDYVRYSVFAQKKMLERMRRTFPSFVDALPNMDVLRGSVRLATRISGLAHPFGFYVSSNQSMATLSDRELLRYDNLSNDPQNSVEMATNAEPHEPWHVLLSSTQLGNWAYAQEHDQNRTETMLREGVAEYLRWPSDPGMRRSLDEWCQAARLEDTNNHRSIAYADPSIDPYVKGSCFFARVERACGLPALNNAFRSLLNQAYEPNATYPHFFGIVDSYCPDRAGYRQVLTNFGFDADAVLSLRRSLIPGFPISNANACSGQ